MSDMDESSGADSGSEYVVKNASKSQEAKKEAKKRTEKQNTAILENRKKGVEKRAELKPVNESRRKDERDLKTLQRLVDAAEAKAKVEALKKRLAELEVDINESRIVQERVRIEKTKPKPEGLPSVPSVPTPTVETKTKKTVSKIRNITVREEESEPDTEEENIEVFKKKPRGRPRLPPDAPINFQPIRPDAPASRKPTPATESIKKVALKEAIEKQTNQLLYNSLFGY